MRTVMIVTALAAGLSAGSAVSAFAECREQTTATDPVGNETSLSEDGRDATEIVQEMVEDAEAMEGSDEPAYVESGPAEPRENWFGCSPSSDAEHCEESEAAQSDSQTSETTQVTAKADDPQDNANASGERARDDAECGNEETG